MTFQGYGSCRWRCSVVYYALVIEEYLGRELWHGGRDLRIVNVSRKLKSGEEVRLFRDTIQIEAAVD